MENLLINDYAVTLNEKIVIDGKEGFKNEEYMYFTILSQNREVIHMEQAALAYYLAENGYNHIAYPVKNIRGNWFTEDGEDKYIALRTSNVKHSAGFVHGRQLAEFHQIGSTYGYEPETVSSYGRWKDLWIKKLTMFEQHIADKAKTNRSNYWRLVMDVLPYIVGISENAIQYMQETMNETRYSENDRGAIAFRRYKKHLLKPVIWTNDLVYDHPMRDAAEYIRVQLFKQSGEAKEEISSFLSDYQSVRPLSIFSWRLLYARLLYPIPFFDLLEKSLTGENVDDYYAEMLDLIDKQTIYEQNAGAFFQMAGLDHEVLDVPVLHWI